MNNSTESLISACHELARTAKCDDYLILNEIADKLKSLQKESNDYNQMFIDSCAGLADIACAVGIKEECDTGSAKQVILKIKLLKKKIRIFELGFCALEPMISLAQSLQEQESKKNE
ncbi:glutamyl-tRNA amidotransferase [Photorhabdus luminescens]|uniref:glutamyl-tRNA amidotransferase n=1 Tax=Photorhabdus TaxID=29487 RepID=UPI000B4CA536|nr:MULTISPECIES: glutamyl-tRNA amidotransferase [Photorhabdus]MCW7549236.1 glutamyl-tRNA amidotransferase [Photorhabdus aballayi]OWO84020.1 glutamyl-tRNA amidotransferase [Photorhabdus luminescens]